VLKDCESLKTLLSASLLFLSPVSKLIISSIVAAIFDPRGLISPVVIVYKIFLQQLWLHKLDWDEQLPSELLARHY